MNPRSRRAWLGLVAIVGVALVALAAAQTVSRFTVTRDDTELVISNLAQAADGARSIGNNANCVEGQRLIGSFGREEFGRSLFEPLATRD